MTKAEKDVVKDTRDFSSMALSAYMERAFNEGKTMNCVRDMLYRAIQAIDKRDRLGS